MNKIQAICQSVLCRNCQPRNSQCELLFCVRFKQAETALTALIKSIVPTEEEIRNAKNLFCTLNENENKDCKLNKTCSDCQTESIRKLQEQKIEGILK